MPALYRKPSWPCPRDAGVRSNSGKQQVLLTSVPSLSGSLRRRFDMETTNKDQERETASATLVSGMHFVGEVEGFRIDLDAEEAVGGTGAGPQPHVLLLQAMAGCTAMDVISILRKKRQQVSGLKVEVQGIR